MKLTEEQIWKCNQTINYENGEVVDAVHICLDHQNVIDFARAIEREIGFDKAELWIKRINEAVLAEREACAKVCEEEICKCCWDEDAQAAADYLADLIRARSEK